MNRIVNFCFLVAILCLINACYTFKDVGIPPDVNTFYIGLFENNDPEALPTLPQTYTNLLKDKITTESRLNPVDTDPDIEFIGTIERYSVSSVAPEEGETTAFNRLEIMVRIEFINNKNEEKNWTKNFPYFNDFGSDENLITIQDELIENIGIQLVEDIFNAAFSDW